MYLLIRHLKPSDHPGIVGSVAIPGNRLSSPIYSFKTLIENQKPHEIIAPMIIAIGEAVYQEKLDIILLSKHLYEQTLENEKLSKWIQYYNKNLIINSYIDFSSLLLRINSYNETCDYITKLETIKSFWNGLNKEMIKQLGARYYE